MLPYLTMHFPLTFSKIQPFVSHITFEIKYPLIDFLYQLYYISSALSFYFIYDFCLYSSMSPLVSYFIRYLPLFIIVITAMVVLTIRLCTLHLASASIGYILHPELIQVSQLNSQQALPQETLSFMAQSMVDSVADVHSHSAQFHVHSQLPHSSWKRWLPCPSKTE